MTSPKQLVVTFPRTIPTERPVTRRVLLVDDDDAVRDMMSLTFERKGFDVVAAANVAEALRFITTQTFDVLISDLHMPNPADGFTVVTAMRHSQPDALTLLVSGYPDVQSELLRDKMLTRKPSAPMERKECPRYCSVVCPVSLQTGWHG